MTESTRQTEADSGVGQWLLNARKARGVSLEEAAEATRIQKSFIDALEREDFGQLPAPAYCKGFIRLYAAYLDISPDDALLRYGMVAAVQTESDRNQASRSGAAETAYPRKSGLRWLLPLTLLSIVILLSLFIDTDQPPPIRPQPPRTETVQSALPPPVQSVNSSVRTAVAPPHGVAVKNEQSEQAQSDKTSGAVLQDGLILRLRVNQDSWLNVDIDGLVSKQYELKAGDLIEWKADSVITLDIGNAGGVEGELNDKPLPSFGGAGKKAHAVIRPEGAVLN